MLRQAKEFKGFKLRASDGDIGKAREFYFDDKHWTVRYLVADSGGWLDGRRVLISPYALDPVNEAEQVLPVDLTKKQIEGSPSLNSDQSVSRQHEMQYYRYYGWPMYWGSAFRWGPDASPDRQRKDWSEPGPDLSGREQDDDPHLHSTHAVSGYHIQAQDGEIGHVTDFIIDDKTWAIRYLLIDTKNWWAGRHVLVSPRWIERVSWEGRKVFVNLSRDDIKRSPAYTPESLNRYYENELHQHYNRQGYWVDEPELNSTETGNATKVETNILCVNY